jgi:tyrosyl-DNA phosphodiesterase-1
MLGDPMIRECWQFNYLHDVDFIMSQFDEDVRRLVKVKVVHGSWKRDAPNRVRIDVRIDLFYKVYMADSSIDVLI